MPDMESKTQSTANSETIAARAGKFFYQFTIPSLLLLFVLGVVLIFSFINYQQNNLIKAFATQEENLQKDIFLSQKDPMATQQARLLLTRQVFQQTRSIIEDTFVVLICSLGGYLTIMIFIVRKLKDSSKQLESFVGQLQGMNSELHQEISKRDDLARKLEDLNGELKYQSMHDTLTHLPNRRLFEDRLNATIKTSKRNKRIFALIFIDLDGFKFINDSLGHNFGDELLKEISSRFSKVLRSMDTIARFGGDEFAIILPELDKPESAAYVAQRLIGSIFEKPIIVKDQRLEVSASIGITIFPYDGDVSEVLLKNADISMYQAKNMGAGNFKFYREDMNTLSKRNLIVRNSLNAALQNSELELHYQPIIDFKTRTIACFEALLRWNHPQLGYITPKEILRTASNLRLLAPLEDWIVKQVCQQIKTWKASGTKVPPISINVSALRMEAEDFVPKMLSILQDFQVQPQEVILEITESSLINNMEKIVNLFQELQKLGLKIAIDDFGTGYSSLSYLRKLPAQILKIDQSFVNELGNNSENCNDIAVLRAVMVLAQELKLEVIAEGVETKEQAKILSDLGCSQMQGYLFSKPLQASDCLNVVIPPL